MTDQHSPLVNKICGREIADVGEGQYVIIVNGETITSIDTPGFDDTYLSDGEVLERIAMSLFTHYKGGYKLSGLLFLRDITMGKMTNTALKNLDMFHHLCGDQSLKNVMFLTTKWDKASTSFAQKQECLVWHDRARLLPAKAAGWSSQSFLWHR